MLVAPPILAGKRVLIVEDEMLVALLIEDFLTEIGCDVVALCGRVQTASDAVRTKAIDLAVLDVNLHGEKVYPVAALLEERQIPFLFLSGYGAEAIPPDRPDWKVCTKPFKAEELARMLSAVVAAAVH
jgi:DNA-binding response OmpR family regulator